MKLPSELLIRTIQEYTHILNPYNGSLITLKNDDYKSLQKLSHIELSKEIRETLQIPKKKSLKTRLFRKNLITLGADYSFPTIVNIEITRRCPLDCKHCYISSEEHKSLDLKDLEKLNNKQVDELVKYLHQLGVFVVVLTGGEPLIAKNLSLFIEKCKKYNIIVELFSCLQTIPPFLANQQGVIGRIQVSIYSLEKKKHDDITNTNDSLKRSLQNISSAKDLGYYVEAVTPLMKLNYQEHNLITKHFKDNDIPHNFSWPILNEYYSEKTGKDSLNISKEEFSKFITQYTDYIIECKWQNPNDSLCEAGIAVFSIAANGDVFPCSQYPLKVGNIFKRKIKDIYQGNKMRKATNFKAKDLRNKCRYYNFCIGNNYSETGDPLKQPTFMVDALKYAINQPKKKGGKHEKNNNN